MHACITTFRGRLKQAEAVRRDVQERILPGLHGLVGFTGGYWLRSRQAPHEGSLLTLWESESALAYGAVALEHYREQAVERHGVEELDTTTYEVGAHT